VRQRKGGVRALEKAALKANKSGGLTMDEMKARTPEGLETPEYSVVENFHGSLSPWEVRKYAEFSVCSLDMDETKKDKKGKGPNAFNTLAGYIFGRNREAKKMAMTTPVLMDSDSGKMSFVMPSNYWKDDSLASAPAPIEGSNVKLEKAPMNEMAVLWFDGYAVGSKVTERKQQLLAAIDDSDDYELATPDAKPIVMQYNDPFVLPWKRRNEVAVPVQKRLQKV
jgi:hypothetical protein